MSDSFAIAAVTATLWYLFFRKEGISVTIKPPDESLSGDDARLNIFLYRVTPNLGYHNRDLPARSYGGELVKKQQLGVDLHYLLTAYGKDNLSAQKILTEAIRILHENSILDRKLIANAVVDLEINNMITGINKSDLAKQLELVKLTMQNLSLEDLTKIWSSFFKKDPYRLSVSYMATIVLLDGKQEASSGLPIRQRNFYAVAPKQPEIRYIDPQMVVWNAGGMEISVMGRNLKADDIRIDFGKGLDVESMPEPKSVTDEEAIVDLPGSSTAGIKQVKIVHPLMLGTPETLHKGIESNVVLFAVVPKIKSVTPSPIAPGNKITVEFEPAMTKDQKASLIVGTLRPLDFSWPDGNATISSLSVTIPSDFKAGIYPVRLKIDGAESQPDDTISNDYRRPTVTITT